MTTPATTQRHYAEMPLRNPEDFRAQCDAMRKELNKHADAIHFASRMIAAKLKKFEKKLAQEKRATAKADGKKIGQIWAFTANYARARSVASKVKRISTTQRRAAKQADIAWRHFLQKYGDEVFGNGAKVFDHAPPTTRRKTA